jgi:hypothetical protein
MNADVMASTSTSECQRVLDSAPDRKGDRSFRTVITESAATLADTPDPNLASNTATVSLEVQ